MIIHELGRFIRESPENRQKKGDGLYFHEPLVGFASATDPLFQSFKDVIGTFHLTPLEFFEAEYGPGTLTEGTVIVWIMPVNRTIRESNRRQTAKPSERWSHMRYHGEGANDGARRHMVELLRRLGHRTVAPVLSSLWERLYDPKVGHASRWSERHAAFVAGLGTFSLSDGLITSKGIAHRVGSVITELALEPTPRPYEGPYDFCLYRSARQCGKCMERCPAGAITPEGHDKDRCFAYMRERLGPELKEKYGVAITGCGLCQTGVPCESRIPKKKLNG
jgi:epoxyqueuosine reductase QueG